MVDYPPWDRATALRDHESAARQPVEPTVDLSTLSPEQKRSVWEYLKRERPELAALIQSPLARPMRDTFDASVHLPRKLVREAIGEH